MIKINFKATKISSIAVYGTATRDTGLNTEDLGTQVKTLGTFLSDQVKTQMLEISFATVLLMVIKILMILSFPAALKIYEFQQVNNNSMQQQEIQKTIDAAQGKLKKVNAEIKKFSYLTDQSREFESKKNFIKKLTESRLIVPRVLDSIQSHIPNTVWLKSISIKVEKEESKLSLRGESLTESVVNSFADSLKNIVDRSSIRVTTQDIKDGDNTVKVGFNLDSKIQASRGF